MDRLTVQPICFADRGREMSLMLDIDSILISAHSLEPSVNRCSVKFTMNLRTDTIMPVKNVKFTKYMERRQEFFDLEEYDDQLCDERVTRASWFEFALGSLDGRNVFVVFQPECDSRFFRGRREIAGEGRGSDLRKACRSFMEVLMTAARTLPSNTETMKGGLGCAMAEVAGNCAVYQRDWASFARKVLDALRSVSGTCGMSVVRFVFAIHGLRLDKEIAERFYDAIVDEGHPHVDVIQVHRTDTLTPLGEAAIFVRLSAEEFGAAFRGCVDYDSGTSKYRMGFLAEFGGFSKYAVLRAGDSLVTFGQAYNSAAKMARIEDVGLLPTFALCNEFALRDHSVQKLADKARQRIRNICYFTEAYVLQGVSLRVEEVMNARRYDIPRIRLVQGIFQPGTYTILLRVLMACACVED